VTEVLGGAFRDGQAATRYGALVTTPEPDKAPVTERPKAVIVGVVLWGLNALLLIGFGLALLFQHGSLVDDYSKLQTNTKLTHEQVLAALDAQLRVYEVVFIGFGVLAAVLVYKVWTQRRWARIALIVVAVADLLVATLLGSSIYTLAGTLLGLFGLIALFTPRVSAYFAALLDA
jgi:hypothetical protein